MLERHSVTEWIKAIRQKDDAAAEALWKRYFSQLMHVARAKMTNLPRSTYDEEDAAISTFRILCDKLEQGNYAELDNRDELWCLMVQILARKIGSRATYEAAVKRKPPALFSDTSNAASAPTNEVGIQFQELLSKLGSTDLEQVAIWKLEGYTNDEIALKLNRTRRTVQRSLELIRSIWQEEASGGR